MWGVLHERPTARHGRERKREAQLTEPVKGKPPTAVQSTLDRIRQPCNGVNKRSERAASPLGAPQILRNEVHHMNEDEIFQIYNLLESIIIEKYYDEDDLRECRKLLRKAVKTIEGK